MPRGPDPTTRRSPAQGGRELRARVSAEEYLLVQAAAEAEGMTVPAYIRTAALSGRYRALLSTVMAATEPVELDRPSVMVEAVEERSCFTCRYDWTAGKPPFHYCNCTTDGVQDYMAESGAESSHDGLPTNRTVRCPGWAAKESK